MRFGSQRLKLPCNGCQSIENLVKPLSIRSEKCVCVRERGREIETEREKKNGGREREREKERMSRSLPPLRSVVHVLITYITFG